MGDENGTLLKGHAMRGDENGTLLRGHAMMGDDNGTLLSLTVLKCLTSVLQIALD